MLFSLFYIETLHKGTLHNTLCMNANGTQGGQKSRKNRGVDTLRPSDLALALTLDIGPDHKLPVVLREFIVVAGGIVLVQFLPAVERRKVRPEEQDARQEFHRNAHDVLADEETGRKAARTVGGRVRVCESEQV